MRESNWATSASKEVGGVPFFDGVWSIFLGNILLAKLDERNYIIRG